VLGHAIPGIEATYNRHGYEVEKADALQKLATLIDKGKVDVPIARVYPLEQVREAFRELEQGHTRGKIVLEP